ncbi:gamma-glutamylcyclotransferase family protein [Streptomyces sp. NPDC053427]|uniref:gamma-glutamylcyclotransferase family protein n=1 Tax=Streptomyces sp. NPDC053427 TaxID=3365701 RepID=UPI0037CF1FEC
MTIEPRRLPFFVYGTLRPGEANYGWTLRGRTATEETARIAGALLYDGPGYPYATAGPADAIVHGTLIRPRDADYDEVCAVLDRLEDYAPGDPENVYERVVTEAVCSDGRTERAWVYLAAEPLAARLRAGGTLIEGGCWPSASAAERSRRPGAPDRAPANLDDPSQAAEQV